MATRAKPKEIIAESQKFFGVVMKVLKWIAITLAVITILIVIMWGINDFRHKQKQAEKATILVPNATVPLASSPQSEWPKLVIPAKGKSQLVPRPSGMKIRMAGQKFEGFNVFEKSECSFLTECPEGSLGSYALNLSNRENIISYAYVPD